jgi:hypothetical protein
LPIVPPPSCLDAFSDEEFGGIRRIGGQDARWGQGEQESGKDWGLCDTSHGGPTLNWCVGFATSDRGGPRRRAGSSCRRDSVGGRADDRDATSGQAGGEDITKGRGPFPRPSTPPRRQGCGDEVGRSPRANATRFAGPRPRRTSHGALSGAMVLRPIDVTGPREGLRSFSEIR